MLSISAFDVNAPSEVDNIYAYNISTTSWDLLGSLAGNNNVWAFTNFTLDASLYSSVAAGLDVRMEISVGAGQSNWLVTLAKSTICTDNVCDAVDPNPTTVPEPATLGLLGVALAGLVAARRRRRS